MRTGQVFKVTTITSAIALASTLTFGAAEAHAQTVAQGPPAYAQLGADAVVLKDGTSLRGDIIEHRPGEKVVMAVFGESTPRTILWADIADVEPGKYAAGGPPSAPAPASGTVGGGPAAPVAGSPGVVNLAINSDEPVTLYRIAGGSVGMVGNYTVYSTYFEPVCVSPCNRVVDGSAGEEFVVLGDGVTPSDTFTMAGWTGDASLDVETGSSALRTGGAYLTAFGATGVITGAIFLPIGLAIDDPGTSVDETFATIGGISLGIGGALLVAGIPMIIASSTDVELKRAEPTKTAAHKPAVVEPTWYLGEF